MSYFDDHEDEIVYGAQHRDPDNVTCKHCGKRGLSWVETGVRWRLVDGRGLHTCKINPTADGFGPVAP